MKRGLPAADRDRAHPAASNRSLSMPSAELVVDAKGRHFAPGGAGRKFVNAVGFAIAVGLAVGLRALLAARAQATLAWAPTSPAKQLAVPASGGVI